GTTCEITDKKGKGLPESGKGEALEIPHSPEKEPVSCLTDWHYGITPVFLLARCFCQMWRERLIRPTKSCKINTLQERCRPDKRSASGNYVFIAKPHPVYAMPVD
ncbi:hypothetical protein JTP46_06795, partial [Escherichia coli]|nr:hypothetical protein [Escherichia coli]